VPPVAPPARASLSGLEFIDPELESSVRRGLTAVEELLRSSVQSSYPFVTETSRHLVDAGGKRFRPLVVLLAAGFGDPEAKTVVPAAVAIELTHLSTLYHDDVMDEAVLRRGAVSANSRWTNSIAILTGDFLFARASEITARKSLPISAPKPLESWRRPLRCFAKARSARRSVLVPAIRLPTIGK
jgi:geranylgeranyl pyrophosphate synthase